MPPGSPQRLRFEEDFADDISNILGVPAAWVSVHGLRPAAGADWMLEVVFQLETDAADVSQVISTPHLSASQPCSYIICDLQQLYALLDRKIKTHQPDIFEGKVTCTLDPTYSRNLIPNGN